MRTRFGGSAPLYNYTLRLRWIAGVLLSVVLMLVCLLVAVLKGDEKPVDLSPAEALASVRPRTIEVLVTRQRIEEGMRIESTMLGTMPMLPEHAPSGALLEKEKERIIGQFARTMITTGSMITPDHLTSEAPLSVLQIPNGFRGITIAVDSRSGGGGLLRPQSRVDVLLTANDPRGVRTVVPVVKFAKVLAVNQATSAGATIENPSTVTVCVRERDASTIELARTVGALSLVLVGTGDPGAEPAIPVSITQLFGAPQTPPEPMPVNRLETVNPQNGRCIVFALSPDGEWKPREDLACKHHV